MRNFTVLFSTLLVLGCHFIATAQFIDKTIMERPMQPSPAASSLLQFVEMPVSNYTGTAQVSIPIYEIKGKDISLPISLSYSFSGLKVADVPSWVGLGWTLNATGVMGRTVADLPDDFSGGFFSPMARDYFRHNGTPRLDSCLNPPPGLTEGQLNAWASDVIEYYDRTNGGTGPYSFENFIDTEPDVYYFNTPTGVSGKFVMDIHQKIHLMPKKPLIVDIAQNGAQQKLYTVRDESGMAYYFGDVNFTNSPVETMNSFTSCTNLTGTTNRFGQAPINAWYLTRMISPRTNEMISFDYEPEHTTMVNHSWPMVSMALSSSSLPM